MNKDLFAIEEYKLAKEKIRKNEERRYGLIALNITAFAAIFGLSDKLDPLVIPIAVTTILLICSVSYTTQSLIQRQTTAFIIVKFEKIIETISYETQITQLRGETWSIFYNKPFLKIFRKIESILKDPFSLLSLLSLVGSGILSYKAIVGLLANNWILFLPYNFIILICYFIIFRSVIIRKKMSLEYYIQKWQNLYK